MLAAHGFFRQEVVCRQVPSNSLSTSWSVRERGQKHGAGRVRQGGRRERRVRGASNELLVLLIGPTPPDIVAELRDMIKAEGVIAAVQTYIEDVNVESGPVGGGGAVGGGTKASQEEMRIAQKRLTSMRNYWQTLSNIVSDETVEVWKQLESDCQNLREMLNARAKKIEEVDSLTGQNAQLKSLLNQYLGDVVTNSSYKVPPSQVMKVRELTNGTIGGGARGGTVGHGSPGSSLKKSLKK